MAMLNYLRLLPAAAVGVVVFMAGVGPADAEANLCQWVALILPASNTCLRGNAILLVWLIGGPTVILSVGWFTAPYLWQFAERTHQMIAMIGMALSGAAFLAFAGLYFLSPSPTLIGQVEVTPPQPEPSGQPTTALEQASPAEVPNPYVALTADDIATRFGIWTGLKPHFDRVTNFYNEATTLTEGWTDPVSASELPAIASKLQALKRRFVGIVEATLATKERYAAYPEVVTVLEYGSAREMIAAIDTFEAAVAGLPADSGKMPHAIGVLDRELRKLIRWKEAGTRACIAHLSLIEKARQD